MSVIEAPASARTRRTLGDSTMATLAGLIAAGYAALGWIAVIPNQDLLADGIQVQRLLADPEWVTSFPGQKHGGVLEYLYSIPAEFIAPANYFAHSFIRVVLAFITAFLAAKLYRVLFAKAPAWSFLLAVAAGPTILHGLAGPPSNPVGVYWLTVTYNLAWLLVTLSAWLAAREFARAEDPRSGLLVVAGIALGLAVYQQPTIGLLIVPLATLIGLRFLIRIRSLWYLAFGTGIGLIPFLINYFFPRTVNTWDPSHFPVLNPQLVLATLGLDGMPTYFLALLPFSMGLAPSETPGVGRLQSALMFVVLTWIVVVAIVGSVRALRRGERPGPGVSIALAWVSAVGAIIAFGAVVDPVWFYGAGLAILLWMSIGVLPIAIRPATLGRIVTIVMIIVIAASTVTHNAYWWRELGERNQAKRMYLADQQAWAQALMANGATFVYGSYFDALPVAYGSAGGLHPITSTYNRFPVAPDVAPAGQVLLVGVNTETEETWGKESLLRVQRDCQLVDELPEAGPFALFSCPSDVLLNPGNGR